jgi:hypothetical protein
MMKKKTVKSKYIMGARSLRPRSGDVRPRSGRRPASRCAHVPLPVKLGELQGSPPGVLYTGLRVLPLWWYPHGYYRNFNNPHAVDPSVRESMTTAANCVNYCDSQFLYRSLKCLMSFLRPSQLQKARFGRACHYNFFILRER